MTKRSISILPVHSWCRFFRGSRRFAVLSLLALAGFMSTAVAQMGTVPLSERQVLEALYNSTGGLDWNTSTHWLDPIGSECSWYGVTCNSNGTHVIEIDLSSNNLTGTLPSLAGLTDLAKFAVFKNQLTGPISPLEELTNLQTFYVHDNQLTGSIPPLEGLTDLAKFAVFKNQLTGPIPPLEKLTNLRNFFASDNQLTGSIPSLAGLTNLRSFHVSDNQLTGPIPSLDGKTWLREFYADSNQLTGAIPSLDGLTSLVRFHVENNRLSGDVPNVPSPNNLYTGNSGLCPNFLNPTPSADWDIATGETPWYRLCVDYELIFSDRFADD